MEAVTLNKVSFSLVSKTYSRDINRLKVTDVRSENTLAWVQRSRRIHCWTDTYSQASFLLVNMKMNRLRHLLKDLYFYISKLIVQNCTPSKWVLQWEIRVSKTAWRRWSLIVSKKKNNVKGPPHYSLSPKCHRVHIKTINLPNSSGQQGSSGDKM